MESIAFSTKEFSKVHYRKGGVGPAVVLLHGFPEDGQLWDPVLPALASSFMVLVPDIPGSGGSTLDGEYTSIEQLAGAVEAVLNREQTDEAVLIGHSMGGYVSLAFAAARRAWVRGLSLVHSTALADNDEKKETRRKSIELIRKGARESFIRGMIPNLFSEQFKEHHPEVIQRQVERGLALQDKSIVAFYNAMINRADRTNILRSGGFPVQWVIGKDDQVVPPATEVQQSLLGNINFISEYEACGHMSMLEQPEKLAKDLKEFIVYCYNR